MAVACDNGILYWPLRDGVELKQVLACDPFRERCRFISLPAGFSSSRFGNARLGVVKGRVRLCKSFGDALKAWELNSSHDDDGDEDDDGWVLVHDIVVKMDLKSRDTSVISLIGLHPEDGDMFFFFRTDAVNNEAGVYKYQIRRESFEKVRDTLDRKQWAGSYFHLVTLVHPWLPTTIPALPSI